MTQINASSSTAAAPPEKRKLLCLGDVSRLGDVVHDRLCSVREWELDNSNRHEHFADTPRLVVKERYPVRRETKRVLLQEHERYHRGAVESGVTLLGGLCAKAVARHGCADEGKLLSRDAQALLQFGILLQDLFVT